MSLISRLLGRPGDGAGDPKLVIAVPDDRGARLANVLLVDEDVGDGLPKSALV